MTDANFSRLTDTELCDWYRVINDLWLGVGRELSRRRHNLREEEDKATRGWSEYRNVEELEQRDADVGNASRDPFK
jgi:hypothetical protein